MVISFNDFSISIFFFFGWRGGGEGNGIAFVSLDYTSRGEKNGKSLSINS